MKSQTALFVKNISAGGRKMTDWNRIGPKNYYQVTMVGTKKDWEKKVVDIETRKHTILRQGYAPSTEGGKLRYWAHVQRPVS